MAIDVYETFESTDKCRAALARVEDDEDCATFVRLARLYTAGRRFLASPEWTESPWAPAYRRYCRRRGLA